MKRIKYIVLFLLILSVMVDVSPIVFGDTWEFGTENIGGGNNPFVPRGYVIETSNGSQNWLYSRYNNTTSTIFYDGKYSGIPYIPATQEDGTSYKLYAMTDRNPAVYQYLLAYKDGNRINDFSSYAGTPGRLTNDGNLGSGAGWAIPITGFQFEPGCFYEFGFTRGMQANNGITLVLSDDGRGYIKSPFTAEEAAKYERDKYSEYEFAIYDLAGTDEEGIVSYTIDLIPMRFTVQTYADLALWDNAVMEALDFRNSVTQADFISGKYTPEGILELQDVLVFLDNKASTQVIYELQPKADILIAEMIDTLHKALDNAKKGKVFSDLSLLTVKINEAIELYNNVRNNIGTAIGQYGSTEVALLRVEIEDSNKLTRDNSQVEIDTAIIRLDSAMIRVKASRVMEETIILSDMATGVMVIAPKYSVPSDVNLYVKILEETTSEHIAYKKNIGDESDFLIYDIRLYSGSKIIQPTEEVSIQIPLKGILSNKEVSIHSVSSSGSYSTMASAIYTGNAVFKTDNVGMFSLITRIEQKRDTTGKPSDGNSDNDTVSLAAETILPLENVDPISRDNIYEETTTINSISGVDLGNTINKEPLSNVKVPLGSLNKGSDPSVILLFAGILVGVALVLCIRLFLNRKKSTLEEIPTEN